MTHTEVFNQARMQRCAEIQHLIMESWRTSNCFAYVARATDAVGGITLTELRKRYFTVGVGDHVWEIPFHDMLVVFSMVARHTAALEAQKNATSNESFTIDFQVSTDFSDADAVKLLSQIQIETPFDRTSHLRIGVKD